MGLENIKIPESMIKEGLGVNEFLLLEGIINTEMKYEMSHGKFSTDCYYNVGGNKIVDNLIREGYLIKSKPDKELTICYVMMPKARALFSN